MIRYILCGLFIVLSNVTYAREFSRVEIAIAGSLNSQEYDIGDESEISFMRVGRAPRTAFDLIPLCFQLKMDLNSVTKVLEDCGNEHDLVQKAKFFNSVMRIAQAKKMKVAVKKSLPLGVMEYDVVIVAPAEDSAVELSKDLRSKNIDTNVSY